MNDGLSNSIIAEYFLLTMYELDKGTSLEEIESLLEEYEERELYWECAGIYNALEYYKFNLSVDLANMLNKEKIKNNIKFTKDDTRNKKKG